MPRRLPLDPPRTKGPKVFLIWFGSNIPFTYELNILSWIRHNPHLHIEIYVNNEDFGIALRERLGNTIMQEHARRPGSVSFNNFSVVHYSLIEAAKDEPNLHAELNEKHGNLSAASDILRVLLLLEKGGLYVDCDIKCVQPLPAVLITPENLGLQRLSLRMVRMLDPGSYRRICYNCDQILAKQDSPGLKIIYKKMCDQYAQRVKSHGTHTTYFQVRQSNLIDEILSTSSTLLYSNILPLDSIPTLDLTKYVKGSFGGSWQPAKRKRLDRQVEPYLYAKFVASRTYGRLRLSGENVPVLLQQACQIGTPESVHILLRACVDNELNQLDCHGSTPLYKACEHAGWRWLREPQRTRRNRSVIQMLLQTFQVDVNQAMVNACLKGLRATVEFAVKNNKTALIPLLGKHNAILDLAMSCGQTPIEFAVKSEKTNLITVLYKHGADPDSTMRCGQTPLTFACETQQYALTGLLILNGANVNKINKLGWTPLAIACKDQEQKYAKLLLHCGAKTHIGKVNQHPMFIVKGNRMLENLLRQYNAGRITNPEETTKIAHAAANSLNPHQQQASLPKCQFVNVHGTACQNVLAPSARYFHDIGRTQPFFCKQHSAPKQ